MKHGAVRTSRNYSNLINTETTTPRESKTSENAQRSISVPKGNNKVPKIEGFRKAFKIRGKTPEINHGFKDIKDEIFDKNGKNEEMSDYIAAMTYDFSYSR